MNDVFRGLYADYYDLFCGKKNYAAEVDTICHLLEQQPAGLRPRDILDLGCGTGGHLVLLRQRGFGVTGVDLSAEMLDRAREKLAAARVDGQDVRLCQADLRTVALRQRYDAAIMMFAVLGYQTGNRDVAAALANVRRHLRPGGLFLFDIWYGPAVLALRPETRVAEFEVPNGRVLRLASPLLDVQQHVCSVRYRIIQLSDQQPSVEASEEHVMRFFFPQELVYYLETSGFEVVSMTAFPDVSQPLGSTTWNALVVARATDS